MEMASLKEVEPLTGYVRGGVTVMAEQARSSPLMWTRQSSCSTWCRSRRECAGCHCLMKPADYLRATGATLADLTKIVRDAAGSEAGG